MGPALTGGGLSRGELKQRQVRQRLARQATAKGAIFERRGQVPSIALSGAQTRNFPQAFTHLALIDAALNLDEALDRVY
jgi:GH15 family glucan-1,4-alpha-glucosidase